MANTTGATPTIRQRPSFGGRQCRSRRHEGLFQKSRTRSIRTDSPPTSNTSTSSGYRPASMPKPAGWARTPRRYSDLRTKTSTRANRREYENNRYNLLPRTTVHGMQRREDRTALGQRQLHSIVFADYRRRHLPGRHPRRPDYGKHPLQRIVGRRAGTYEYASTPRSTPTRRLSPTGTRSGSFWSAPTTIKTTAPTSIR